MKKFAIFVTVLLSVTNNGESRVPHTKLSRVHNGTELVSNRDAKIFNLFHVVSFSNTACRTGDEASSRGTCYSETECLDR